MLSGDFFCMEAFWERHGHGHRQQHSCLQLDRAGILHRFGQPLPPLEDSETVKRCQKMSKEKQHRTENWTKQNKTVKQDADGRGLNVMKWVVVETVGTVAFESILLFSCFYIAISLQYMCFEVSNHFAVAFLLGMLWMLWAGQPCRHLSCYAVQNWLVRVGHGWPSEMISLRRIGTICATKSWPLRTLTSVAFGRWFTSHLRCLPGALKELQRHVRPCNFHSVCSMGNLGAGTWTGLWVCLFVCTLHVLRINGMQIGSFQAPNGELHSSPGHSNKIKQHVCAMCAHERANFAIGGKGGGQGTNGGQTWTAAAEAHFDTLDTLTIDPPEGHWWDHMGPLSWIHNEVHGQIWVRFWKCDVLRAARSDLLEDRMIVRAGIPVEAVGASASSCVLLAKMQTWHALKYLVIRGVIWCHVLFTFCGQCMSIDCQCAKFIPGGPLWRENMWELKWIESHPKHFPVSGCGSFGLRKVPAVKRRWCHSLGFSMVIQAPHSGALQISSICSKQTISAFWFLTHLLPFNYILLHPFTLSLS